MLALAVVAAVIVAVLFVRIRICALYKENVELWVRVLFLKIPILPRPEKAGVKKESKKKSNKKIKAEKSEKSSDKKPSVPEKIADGLSLIKEMLGPLRRAMRRLVRAEKLDVQVQIGADDAANTAVYTGMLWGVGYNLIGLLNQVCAVESHHLNVLPSYDKPMLSAEADCILRTSLANIICAAFILGIAFLRYKFKNRRNKE